MGGLSGVPAARPAPGGGDAAEFRGYEALLELADKERGDAAVLGWDARRMRRFLAALGEPQQRLRCTLVAGSKGKGSTAAMLESCLRAAGRRTGLYTQPHLHRYAERIRIDGRTLTAPTSRAGLRTVLAAAPGPVTAFEAATAFALWAFARAGVEEAVLEVGFGGRLDAAAEADPAMVLLLPLEREHADILGPTQRDVAGHDLQLLRYGRICFAAPQPASVAPLLAARCASQGLEDPVVPDPVALPGGVRLHLPAGGVLETTLGLPGAFQRANAALAATGAAALGCGPTAIAAGLAAARWPGRWEQVAARPRVIVDSAHTPGSAAAARAALTETGLPERAALVAGMFADKDAPGFAAAWEGLPLRVFATEPDHPRALPARALAAAFGGTAVVEPGLPAALDAARRFAGPHGLILVAGSLRLAAQARALLARRWGPRAR